MLFFVYQTIYLLACTCIRLFICWLVLVSDYLFVGFYLFAISYFLLAVKIGLYIWFPKVCGFAVVPAGMWISVDSGYGYCFMPVAGCERGCGRRFWLAGAGLSNPYPRGFYPLPSWFWILVPASAHLCEKSLVLKTILFQTPRSVESLRTLC